MEADPEGERFRSTQEVTYSWGINESTGGIPKMERREVGKGAS